MPYIPINKEVMKSLEESKRALVHKARQQQKKSTMHYIYNLYYLNAISLAPVGVALRLEPMPFLVSSSSPYQSVFILHLFHDFPVR